MSCEPALSAAVLMLALPPDSVAVPSEIELSKNCTEPSGTPAPGANAATVAEIVVDCPNTVGFGVLLAVVVVLAWPTVCVWIADVLPTKLALPAYTAVMLCEPTLSADVLMLALPPDSVAVPSEVRPSKNCTLPVAVPEPGAFTATLAEIVVDCPNTVGFGVLLAVVVVLAWPTVCVWIADVLPL